jgi:hypothetical protein
MRTFLTLILSLCLVFKSHSRVVIEWGFDQLKDKANAVLVATPTSVTAITNQSTLAGSKINGIWVETSFRILGVLKGDRTIKEIKLLHLTGANLETKKKNGDFIMYVDGPRLLTFEPNSNKQYLMFLQKETDGRYVAVTGQEDPIDSVFQFKDDVQVWMKLMPQALNTNTTKKP